MAEAVKVAFADREEWLIDPERAHNIAEVPAGMPYDQPHDRRAPEGDTCYLCAADRDGMVVSVIQSIYHDFGSAVIGDDTGIIMQNRGAFFALDERHTNHLQPGKTNLPHTDSCAACA